MLNDGETFIGVFVLEKDVVENRICGNQPLCWITKGRLNHAFQDFQLSRIRKWILFEFVFKFGS